MDTVTLKTCTTCKETKSSDLFSRSSSKRDGLQHSCKACNSAYHHANKHRIRRRRSSPEVLARRAAYRAANPHLAWEDMYRRRALKYGFPVVLESFTRAEVIERYGDQCFHCGVGAFEHLDHLVPIRAGGTHVLENARPSCASCNRSRAATALCARCQEEVGS